MDALIITEPQAVKEEPDEEESISDGWSRHSYNNGHAMYRCDGCWIVMRHDYIHKHKCIQRPLLVDNERIVL